MARINIICPIVLCALLLPLAAHAQIPLVSATVSGRVVDASGGAVAAADVTLTSSSGSDARSSVSGADGAFAFQSLPAGSYVITVKAPGFQPHVSASFVVAAESAFHVPDIVLSVPTINTTVDVRPTEVIAAQQIKAEERQRVFGVLPDFYTSYVWNAAPLTTKQKFLLATRRAVDPASLVGISIGAGIQQARNTYPEFGQGAGGYAKRWGALFAETRTSAFLNRAVFPSLFHQDPRYFYQGSGSTWSRIGHAVGFAFVARSDSGHLMPNYSAVLGEISSGAVSNLYYPASSRGAGLILTNVALGFAGRAAHNLTREFLFKHLTTHVPDGGKPAI